jgi:hypothetical protein
MTAPQETWRVWKQEDGRWRWTWEGPEGETLFSAHTFSSPDEAEESVRAAYPNLLGTVEGRTVVTRVTGVRGRTLLLVGGCVIAAVLARRLAAKRSDRD